MLVNDRWLLPEGIEEILPPEAMRLERSRRELLDLFASWGYELVFPPLIEYLESLLTGTGHDLDLQTFKLTDQLSGRLMGVRADITPQAARIDAHYLRREAPTRLCYLGTALRTRPDGFAGSRSPLQLGAELFGFAGIEADVEIICLMAETLNRVGISTIHLDLGHVGIFRGLARLAGLDTEAEATLFAALQRKSIPDITEFLARSSMGEELGSMFVRLAGLNGGEAVLAEARAVLAKGGPQVAAALDELQAVARRVGERLPDVPLHFDLAELRGYNYHTGAVFAAFIPGRGQAIAQGGRYDDVGRVFGRARPATGFSTDLKSLMALNPHPSPGVRGIFAPCDDDPRLVSRVRELRAAGERVVQALPGQQGGAAEMGCDRQLAAVAGEWQILPVSAPSDGG